MLFHPTGKLDGLCHFMPGCPVGIGLCSFAKSGAARLPALQCKDTSPSNYYIIFHCNEINLLGHAAVLAQPTVCWEAIKLYCSWLNDDPIEQGGWHVLRCGVGQGCCILNQLLLFWERQTFARKRDCCGIATRAGPFLVLRSGFYLMPASTNTDTETLHKDVKNLSSHLPTPSLNNKS